MDAVLVRPFLCHVSDKFWFVVETNHFQFAALFNISQNLSIAQIQKAKPKTLPLVLLRQVLQPIGNLPVPIVQAKRVACLFLINCPLRQFLAFAGMGHFLALPVANHIACLLPHACG